MIWRDSGESRFQLGKKCKASREVLVSELVCSLNERFGDAYKTKQLATSVIEHGFMLCHAETHGSL
jgi:hypothetical protein